MTEGISLIALFHTSRVDFKKNYDIKFDSYLM